MANTTRGTSQQGNFLVPRSGIQLPSEPLFDSRYQGCASDFSVGNVAPALPLGLRFETFDGRVFRFVENGTGTAFVEGSVLASIANVTMTSCSTDATGTIITGTSPAATQYLDEHRGSYAYISVGTGEGVARRIVTNSASAASTAGMTLTLERSIGASLSSLTVIIHSPWRLRLVPISVVAPSVSGGISGRVTGVSFGAVAAQTASGLYAGGVSFHGWVQTKGLCEKVLVTAASPAASALSGGLTASATVAGSADPIASGATPDDAMVFGYTFAGAGTYDVGTMANLFCE